MELFSHYTRLHTDFKTIIPLLNLTSYPSTGIKLEPEQHPTVTAKFFTLKDFEQVSLFSRVRKHLSSLKILVEKNPKQIHVDKFHRQLSKLRNFKTISLNPPNDKTVGSVVPSLVKEEQKFFSTVCVYEEYSFSHNKTPFNLKLKVDEDKVILKMYANKCILRKTFHNDEKVENLFNTIDQFLKTPTNTPILMDHYNFIDVYPRERKEYIENFDKMMDDYKQDMRFIMTNEFISNDTFANIKNKEYTTQSQKIGNVEIRSKFSFVVTIPPKKRETIQEYTERVQNL